MVLPDHYANTPMHIYLPSSLLAGLKDLHRRNWKHGALVRKNVIWRGHTAMLV